MMMLPLSPPQRSFDCFLLVEPLLSVHAGKCGRGKIRNLCRITCVNLPFNAQMGQFLVWPIPSLFTWVDISPYTEMYPVVQEINEATKSN